MKITNMWELNSNNVRKLSEKMVGHKIVSFTDDILTLDNGVEVLLEETNEWGSYFFYDMSILDTDHVITSVTSTWMKDSDVKYGEPDGYVIHILAEDTKIGVIDIYGDEGDGRYVQSIQAIVREKE